MLLRVLTSLFWPLGLLPVRGQQAVRHPPACGTAGAGDAAPSAAATATAVLLRVPRQKKSPPPPPPRGLQRIWRRRRVGLKGGGCRYSPPEGLIWGEDCHGGGRSACPDAMSRCGLSRCYWRVSRRWMIVARHGEEGDPGRG
eukprot:8010313-Pyramimonas_sp.AAC.1